MMNDDFAFGAFMGFVIGAIIAVCITISVYRQEALRAGVGEYNQKTGHFQWKVLEVQ